MCCTGIYPPPVQPLDSIACILIPLTSERLRYSRDRYACPLGGLKGKTAPGDAHPYLVLF
jgi:hypothetical protein